MIRPVRWLWLLPLLVISPVGALEIAVDGHRQVTIVIAADASPTERGAAEELGVYLGRVTGASFPIAVEAEAPTATPAIHVGSTTAACTARFDPAATRADGWLIETFDRGLAICGGQPRGTLYGVYRFLERWVGVRWWTPFDESVPVRRDLAVEEIHDFGAPVFAYRDIAIESGAPTFRAHSMLNGHFSRLPSRLGGSLNYSSPHHTHTAYLLVPPEQYYAEHPQYFAEVGGMRYAGDGQLCMSQPAVVELVIERALDHVIRSRERALRLGFDPPSFVSISQNDWERPCGCAACARSAEVGGGQSAPLLQFVNAVARGVAEVEPTLFVETLAYQHTLDPPRGVRAEPNVVVRVSGLHQRDFLRPVGDAANRQYADALAGWQALADHLHVWDYAVPFGEHGNLPIGNLELIGRDLRLYRSHGVEGVYVQPEDPISDDLRDLKTWVIAKLLVDPDRDVEALIRDFTNGYYGPAGKTIHRYWVTLRKSTERAQAAVRYGASADRFDYLDRRFFRRAHKLFDRAERQVASEPRMLERVRHGRLSLDRAALTRWPDACGRRCSLADFDDLARRYRATWERELRRRVPGVDLQAALAEVDREIRYWATESGGR